MKASVETYKVLKLELTAREREVLMCFLADRDRDEDNEGLGRVFDELYNALIDLGGEEGND